MSDARSEHENLVEDAARLVEPEAWGARATLDSLAEQFREAVRARTRRVFALVLSRLHDVTPEMVEAVAKVIDPEAWGLPPNLEDGTITDRDEARDRARAAITAYLAASPLNGGK